MTDRGDDKKKNKGLSSKKKNEGDSGSEDDYDPELEKLPETERERIIMERFEKRQREKKKQELEREKTKSSTANKQDLLSQLQTKRQNAKDKKERMAAENKDDSDENDDSESEGEINNRRRKKKDADEDYVAHDEDKKAMRARQEKKRKKSPSRERKSPEKPQTLTMGPLEKIRLSRKQLGLLCSHNIFQKTVQGAFVRVNTQSTSSKNSAHDYVIAQIVGVKDYHKNYSIDDKETNKILILKHGSKERPMKMCFVSNGDFTGVEFTKWLNKMQRENQRIPTLEEIERKAKEIEEGLKYRYSGEEISSTIDQRIHEKLKKGDGLTPHEIEILENRKIQKDRDYWSTGSKNESLKREIERLEESIKKAKSLLKNPKPKAGGKMDEEKDLANEMAEMFGDDDEEEKPKEKEKDKGPHKKGKMEEDDDKDDGEVEEETEQEKHEQDIKIEELKKKGLSTTEIYEEIKKDFIKAHKVDLGIDKLIDEWEIENEAAA